MEETWRPDLEAWLAPFIGALRHKTRGWVCPAYIAGRIGPGDRKGNQPMAPRDGSVGYDRLHHFIASGVWDSETALLTEADKMVGDAAAWLIIDDTALPKKGHHSQQRRGGKENPRSTPATNPSGRPPRNHCCSNATAAGSMPSLPQTSYILKFCQSSARLRTHNQTMTVGGAEEGVGASVVALVGDENLGVGKNRQGGVGAPIVADLAFGQQQNQRLAVTVAHRMQLRVHTNSGH